MAEEKKKTANTRQRRVPTRETPNLRNLKLKINNVGKIKSADIETSNLTLLLGKNNTGKSYLATLLWAAYDLRSLVALIDKRPKWFLDLFRDISETEQTQFVFTKKQAEELIRIVNTTLKKSSSSWMSNIFAFEGFENSNVEFEVQIPNEELQVSILEVIKNNVKLLQVTIDDLKGNKFIFPMMPLEMREWVKEIVFEAFVRATIFGQFKPSKVVYIPAARTGLMLAFPALISETLGILSMEQRNGNQTKLSMATTKFLQQLAFEPSLQMDGPGSKIAHELEKKVLHGTVVKQRIQGLTRFSYEATGSDVKFPLHVTSSMVTELAPFTLVLKGLWQLEVIVFEEPEAHLHLAAQRAIARALAQLVNLGTKVIVTSHSDTFVQEINNLIQLHESPERDRLMRELGYSENDLVDPAKVKGYEFREEKSITSLSEIELTDQGLAVPSLTDEIISLAEATTLIQQNSEPQQ